MLSLLLRQDFIPILAGYLIVMAALGIGLRLSLRPDAKPGTVGAGRAAGPAGQVSAVGWRRLVTHVAGTALGGYLLLMIIVILYYYGVARVTGEFLKSAFTGCAMLIGLTAPVFLLASWVTERRRARAGRTAEPPARSGESG
ncbi:MAG TPA: DUF6256 family protein [Streptosporangiaceae bacterium]|nr:DUF6256 family protein [Streptosporangiaceae bacterium]